MSTPLQIGPYLVRTLTLGTFRLDGGAMFGSVPRPLWQRNAPPDEHNRITLATRSLWIEEIAGDRRILVDVGNGDKYDDRVMGMFMIENTAPEIMDVPLEDTTDVILTHLHFDHAGGISTYCADGDIELTYPHATVYLQGANWENAMAPSYRERASYLPENIAPLEEADLRLLDGEVEMLPDIRAMVFDGHTRGLQAIIVGSGHGAVAFPSDLIPTASHLHLPWIMGYDRAAETTLVEKQRFLEQAVEERWVIVFEHDPEVAAATVTRDDRGKYIIDELVEL